MKCFRYLIQAMRSKETVVLWVGIGFFIPLEAYGQAEFAGVCSDPGRHGAFIQASLGIVLDEGAAREEVLDELICIATSENRWTTGPALRAVFHIAKGDDRIRECLLRVINDERTTGAAASEASRLLAYVADKKTRSDLLERVKQQWHHRATDRNWNAGWTALVELGDVDFLRWLDKTAEGLGANDPLRSVFDRARRMIRLQESVPDLFAYFRSGREDIDRAWVVRQAIRHGASREDIRNAVLTYLRRVGGQRSPSASFLLVRACDEHGIFTSEDVEQIETIKIARQTRFSSDNGGQWPSWATLPEAKRAEFYHLEH